ncbi:hypothetical protein L9F63_017465, partial [Diploptera punctata]
MQVKKKVMIMHKMSINCNLNFRAVDRGQPSCSNSIFFFRRKLTVKGCCPLCEIYLRSVGMRPLRFAFHLIVITPLGSSFNLSIQIICTFT